MATAMIKKGRSSQPPTDETTTFYTGTLTFDLVADILCRLPVKVLMKLRCVCKSWNSLISDPKFAKEHLRFSRTLLNRHHLLSCHEECGDAKDEFHVWDSRLPFVFNTESTTFPMETQLILPLRGDYSYIIDSCNGIICFCCHTKEGDFDSILVWNPSIRKFKILPPLEKELQQQDPIYGFGYDCVTDNYKVVAVCCREFDGSNYGCETQVVVHTLGTDTWKSISTFPSTLQSIPNNYMGKFVSGNINWLMSNAPRSWVIVALDLGNESYHELLLPNYGAAGVRTLTMGVLRDCLCILAHTKTFGIHVWLMNDYGNNESWTQLFTIPYSNGLIDSRSLKYNAHAYAHYILEDDQLLMDYEDEVFVYNPRNGTPKILKIQDNYTTSDDNHVYIESLISP